ncbi:MAG: porin [Burkholderiaceae bacterium]|nr:MAG: porin [Burkholderiaceae bacterium]
MKKTLLAAALVAGFAGLTGVAQAETSVTLYGLLDSGIGYQQFRGTNEDTGSSVKARNIGLLSGGQSSNRWGLKGTEDLGDGLKAVFVLENGFDIGTGTSSNSTSTGTNRFFGRQATVGLMSDAWGRLDFGRQTNIATKYFAWAASPFGTDYSQAQVGTAFSAAANQRYDNMIMYQTPSFSGFQFGVGYSFNADGNQQFKKSGGEQPNTRAWTTGLRYTNGPIAAALVYDQFKSADTATVIGDRDVSVKSWSIGGSYDFEVVKVFAGFGQTRNGWFTLPSALLPSKVAGYYGADVGNLIAADGAKINSYTLGLSAPVGINGKVLAGWTMADPRRSANGSDERGSKQNVYSLAYTYALSKRTDLYAIGSYAQHVAFADDLKSTFIGAGVRHQF